MAPGDAGELILEYREFDGHKEHLDYQQEDDCGENEVGRRFYSDEVREEYRDLWEYAENEQQQSEEQPIERVADEELSFSQLADDEDECQDTESDKDNSESK